ncbi:MAG: hypothetical protein HGA98_03095, partial [Deltaproteobacteria bacterium]|nr:hypothetical protein [Deltaproteobacteria bacterium]
TGTTRDLGRLGACFVSETGCVPGETLALRLALPSPRPGKILYAICKGQVVRAEQRGPGEGNATAVAFRDVSFEGFGADGGFGWLDQGLYDV